MFLADLDYTQLNTKFTKPVSRQRLCQDVSQLLLSADVLNVQLPIPNTLADEMKSDIYMFTPIVEDRIFTESNSRLAVHLENEGCALLALQLGEQLRQPNTLAGRCCPCYILSFARGQSDDLLLL